MQNPAAFDANVDFIIKRIGEFIGEEPAVDLFQVNQRHHFLQSAYRILTDWRATKPCQITYSNLYAREKDLVGHLETLGGIVSDGFARFNDVKPDDNYLNPSDNPYGYFTDKDGFVTRILPWDLHTRWPEVDSLPEDLRPRSRLKVGDHIRGRATRGAAVDDWTSFEINFPGLDPSVIGSPMECSPKECLEPSASPSPIQAATSAPPVTIVVAGAGAPVMSDLLAMFLDELAQEAGGDRTADRDLRPYVDFWIHVVGDKPIAQYSREDARSFCEKVAEIPHLKGMQAQSPVE